MKTIQEWAVFMIFLVLTLPIYSAMVYAQFNVYSVNSEGVENYRAAADTTTVVAEIGEIGVTKDELTIGSKQFHSCIPTEGISVCEFNYVEGNWPASRYPYTVNYNSQSGIQTESGRIIVDNTAPNVTLHSVFQRGGELTITYSVKERALEDSTSNECSGIKSIDVTLGGEVINTTVFDFEPETNCNYNQKTMTISALSTNDVLKYLCLEVSDNVRNIGKGCSLIIVDAEVGSASEPHIVAGNGQVMEYISPKIGPFSAYVRFKLNERNLSSIKADASEFSFYPQQQEQMKDVPVVCTPRNCNGTCSCDALITLNLPAGGTPVLKLNITDVSGNNALALLPVEIKVDSESPYVESMTAKTCGDKNALGPKSKNNITVVVSEAGSGMNAGKIYLDLSSVRGAQASRVPKNYCNPSDNKWICLWGPFAVTTNPRHGSNLQIPIGVGSQDDAGNFLVSEPGNFFYDSEQPEFVSSKIRAVRNVFYGSEIEDYPSSGGTMELTVIAKDDLPLTATADFSKVSHVGKRTVECEGTANKTCVFSEIGPLINGPKSNLVIPINITDCVGNTYSSSVKMNISVLTEKQGDYWSYQVTERKPDVIDKSTMSAFAHSVFFKMQTTPNGNAKPISQTVISCEGETGYLNSSNKGQRLPVLIGAPSENLMTKFTLQRTSEPPDNFNFICTIKTITRTTTGYISPPEYDNVTFEIKTENEPMGTIDEATQDKVDRVRNSWLVKGNIISTLEKIIDTLEMICRLWGVLANIGKILDSVSGVLCTIKIIPGACESMSTASTNFDKFVNTEKGIAGFMNKVCKYVSCEAIPFLGKESGIIKGAIETWRGSFITSSKYGTGVDFNKILGVNGTIDPKDSLIFSVATMCLPGIVHNLNKARQIECNYIYCVENQVTAGVPVYMCDAVRVTAWCKYVWHELFQFIPFTHAIDELFSQLGKVFEEPLYAASLALAICEKTPEPASSACRFTQNVLTGTSVITNLLTKTYWNNLLSTDKNDPNMCDLIKKEEGQ